MLLGFRFYYKALLIAGILASKQTHRSPEQKTEPRSKPTHLWSSTFMTKEPRMYKGERTVPLLSSARKPEQTHAKE